MSGFYSNPSASPSSDSMNTYDFDSLIDLSGGMSTPSLNSGTSDNWPAPSFQYDAFPQQTEPLPYNGFNSASNLSSPSMGINSLAVSPTNQSSGNLGMEVDGFDSTFFLGDFSNSNNITSNINDKEADIDVLAGIKQERSTSNASSMSSVSSNYRPSSSRKSAAVAYDAATEERIRLILEDVKQKAMNEHAQHEGSVSPLPHLTRSRKDEEDMDEDERLLASEEGKKLSSKERRQLRNKVSARAFRSRRKEYIGQLESECQTKQQEVNELKTALEKADAEIKNLKDLTRLLLASPQFSAFLDQLHPATANNGLNLAAMAALPSSSFNDDVSVRRVTVPEIQYQAPINDFQIPTHIPNNYMPVYNRNKDVNPNQVQGIEDWPLADQMTNFGVGGAYAFNAEIPTDLVDATELAGKSMFDALAPCDGFRPDFCASIPNEKEPAELDYSSSYDNNGQYIFDVYEDELEDVPDYLYDHFQIHAPLGEEKETAPLPKAEDVLPKLGLTKLFAELEQKFDEQEQSVVTSPEVTEAPSQTCKPTDLHRTLEAIESTYRRIGVYCSM